MNWVTVTYKIKPEMVSMNADLVRAVFEELRAVAPSDFRYATLSDGEGRFVHLVQTSSPEFQLTQLDAFRAFQANIRERCIDPPLSREMTKIDSFRIMEDDP